MRRMFMLAFLLAFQFLGVVTAGAESPATPDFRLMVQRGHVDYVLLTFSADGAHLYSASGTNVIIRTAEGQIIKEFAAHSKLITGIITLPGTRGFATTSEDGTVKLWSPAGELRKTMGPYKSINALVASPDLASFAFAEEAIDSNNRGVAVHVCTADGTSLAELPVAPDLAYCYGLIHFSPDGRRLACLVGKEFSVWNIAKASLETKLTLQDAASDFGFTPDGRVLTVQSGRLTAELYSLEGGAPESIGLDGMAWYLVQPPGKTSFLGYSTEGVVEWSYKGQNLRKLDSSKAYEPFRPITDSSRFSFSSVAKHPGKDLYAAGLGAVAPCDILLFDGQLKVIQRLKRLVKPVCDLITLPGQDTFYTLVANDQPLMRWDAATLKGTPLDKERYTSIARTKGALSPDARWLASTAAKSWEGDQFLDLHSLAGNGSLYQKRFSLKHPGIEFVSAMAFNSRGDRLLVGTTDHIVRSYDLEGKLLAQTAPGQLAIDAIAVRPGFPGFMTSTTRTLELWGEDGTLQQQVFSTTITAELIHDLVYDAATDHFLAVSRTGIRFFSPAGKQDKWLEYNFAGNSLKELNVALSPDGQQLLVATPDDELLVFQRQGMVVQPVPAARLSLGGGINAVRFTTDSTRVIAAGNDGRTTLWNPRTGGKVTLLSSGNEWIVYDDAGYFDASENGGQLVAMVQGMTPFSVDQFALSRNRPDRLIQELSPDNQALIEHFARLFTRRQQQAGLQNPAESASLHLPQASIATATAKGRTATVTASLADPLVPLVRYNVWVNGVPLYSMGKTLPRQNKAALTESIPLLPGKNRIELGCQNEQGTESLRALAVLECTEKLQGELYFLGFGVSTYRDASLNLKYADKDAKDLGQAFATMKSAYNKINLSVFTNEQVTVDAIRQARTLLEKTRPEDTVVLFIAGHGIHDTDPEATYYYLTHEADPRNLAATAANFGLIEDLLQGIPARQKLFLMDTCESGELDPLLEDSYFAGAAGQNFVPRTTRGLAARKAPDSPRRPYLSQKDRYIETDLRRRTGAIVLSSCRGGEFSYESDQAGNGFFTAAILQALNGSLADRDRDGLVQVDELKSEVAGLVAKLSGGLQNPVIDRNNLMIRFGFPHPW